MQWYDTTDSFDVYLIKTDASGNALWIRTYGGNSWDQGNSVQQTTDGGYIIAGYAQSYGAGNGDVYLIRTNANGDTLWTKTYGGTNVDDGLSVQQTSDGGFIIVGETVSFGAGNFDIYLIKTDSNGDTLWTRTYGGTNEDRGESVQETINGGYILLGETKSYGVGNLDIYVIKTNTNGDTIWTKTIGGAVNEWGRSIQQTSDNGYVIGGLTNSFGAGLVDVYLIKLGEYAGIDEEFKYVKEQGNIFFAPYVFKDNILLKCTEPSNNSLKIALYNIYGSLVFVKVFPYTPCLLTLKAEKIKRMSSGIYFLSVSSNGIIEMKKLIKL